MVCVQSWPTVLVFLRRCPPCRRGNWIDWIVHNQPQISDGIATCGTQHNHQSTRCLWYLEEVALGPGWVTLLLFRSFSKPAVITLLSCHYVTFHSIVLHNIFWVGVQNHLPLQYIWSYCMALLSQGAL